MPTSCTPPFPKNQHAKRPLKGAWFGGCQPAIYQKGPTMNATSAVRSMNEKTVAQTREVYDRSKDAFDASLSTLERTFDAAGQGVVAFHRKFVDIAQRNVNAAFDLAKSMAGAKNLAEILQLQGAYWQKRCGNLTSQAEEVRALSTKVTADVGEQLKRGV